MLTISLSSLYKLYNPAVWTEERMFILLTPNHSFCHDSRVWVYCFFTMWISLQTTNSGNVSKTFIVPFYFYKLKKKSCKLREIMIVSTCHRTNRLQISAPVNKQPQFPPLPISESGISLDPMVLGLQVSEFWAWKFQVYTQVKNFPQTS